MTDANADDHPEDQLDDHVDDRAGDHVDDRAGGAEARPPLPPDLVRRQAIVALASNIAVLVFCFPLGGLVGAIVAGVGLIRARTRPESARNLIRWAWIVLGVSVALSLVVNIWTVVAAD